jgi:hypothetical protein
MCVNAYVCLYLCISINNYYVSDTLCDLNPILSEDEINAAPIDMQREIKKVLRRRRKKNTIPI